MNSYQSSGRRSIPLLTEDSTYKREIVSQLYSLNYGTAQQDYKFSPVKLMTPSLVVDDTP